MLNHISIAVNDPKKVADILAELWGGMVIPFPPAPDSFIVLANDGRGSAVEVTPAGTVLVPGEGLPPEDDLGAATAEYEAKFVKSEYVPQYVATHLNISTELSIDEIRAIGKREGWRTFVANRDGGLFQLVELWIEGNFMLEVMTPAQTARYREITSPAFIAKAFAGDIPGLTIPKAAETQSELSLIG
jgi:hypothetical protein